MNRAHTITRGVLAILLGGLLVAGTLLAFEVIHSSRRAIFLLVLALVAIPSILWWGWLDQHLGHWPSKAAPWLRAAVGLYTAAMLSPFVLVLGGWRTVNDIPTPVLMWLLVWHLVVGLGGGLWVLGYPFALLARLAKPPVGPAKELAEPPLATAHSPSEIQNPQSKIQNRLPSRRAILRGALAAAPLAFTGGCVLEGIRRQGQFAVRELSLTLPRLPKRLDGLTIAHVSDLHLGRFTQTEHLPAITDAVNGLKADLVAFTGDLIDHNAGDLPAGCDWLSTLQGRYGRLVVIGNHDLFEEPIEVPRHMAEREPGYVQDGNRVLEIGGERLQIAGLFWSRDVVDDLGVTAHQMRASAALAGADPGLCTVALAHHPHAFDALADRGVDLTLSGHTHAGQLMLTPPEVRPAVGGGSLLFRYVYGTYRRGGSLMYVNGGVGNWFPVRINAPTEIVRIRLLSGEPLPA